MSARSSSGWPRRPTSTASTSVAFLLGVFARRYLASLGYRQNLSSIAVDNTSSLRMQSRSGSERIFYVSYLRILFYERLRVSREIPV